MIRFMFAPQGSPRLRIAYSPLWECVISVRVLLDPASHALFQPWIRRAGAAVDAGDVRLLGALVRSDGRYIPDFLAPPPSVPGAAFGAELARVRNTPPEVLRAEVARAADGAGGAEAARLLARYDADPLALRAAVAEVLERYWRAAIMPEWPRIEPSSPGRCSGARVRWPSTAPARCSAACTPR
jgi:hypothetical protein